jgi:hypothetical protein
MHAKIALRAAQVQWVRWTAMRFSIARSTLRIAFNVSPMVIATTIDNRTETTIFRWAEAVMAASL